MADLTDDDMLSGGPDETHPCPKCGKVSHGSADSPSSLEVVPDAA